MTLEELVNLKISKDLIITDGNNDYTVTRIDLNPDYNYPKVRYVFTAIDNNVVNDIIVVYHELCTASLINPMKARWLNSLSIKPKQKESKMKTTFKQEPKNTSENSFPKFMKYKTTTLTILFFNEKSGIVVVEDSDWRVNTFADDWNISLFEPIENCEVTFSNKE